MVDSHDLTTATTKEERRKRKEEAKRLKRKRIEDAGGIRPRQQQKQQESSPSINNKKKNNNNDRNKKKYGNDGQKQQHNNHGGSSQSQSQNYGSSHKFGRVMDNVPCINKSRHHTLSIAIPGSIISNCQTRELKTLLVGQIARYCTIYHVDEIIIYDDKLSAKSTNNRDYRSNRNNNNRDRENDNENKDTQEKDTKDTKETETRLKFTSDPHLFMARILQYCECPQYLRKQFFPRHPDLQFVGLINPIDAPHHVRVHDKCKYREGVVIEKKSSNGNSLVNCGIRGRPVEINRSLQPGIRCTVELNVKEAYSSSGSNNKIYGKVVSPTKPREDDGTYWGYTVRMANSITNIFDECPYNNDNDDDDNDDNDSSSSRGFCCGYDLTIGTSERSTLSIDDDNFQLLSNKHADGSSSKKKNNKNTSNNNNSNNNYYKHILIVFGGVCGIEECIDADETITDHTLTGSNVGTSGKLFDMWINICKYQGSRTIRTEEALLITLAKLNNLLLIKNNNNNEQHQHMNDNNNNNSTQKQQGDNFNNSSNIKKEKQQPMTTTTMEFSDDDESISDESSDDE